MADKPQFSSEKTSGVRAYLGVFRYGHRALLLVWSTSRSLTLCMAFLTLIAGLLPAAMAYLGKMIVDSTVAAAASQTSEDLYTALTFVALEGLLIAALAATQKGLGICQSLLRALLGQRVNVLILEKALTLNLEQFEDSEFYDKMTRARREASMRPLSLVNRTFSLVQNGISLISYGGLLWQFSPWAVLVLALAGIPAFFVETKFSGDAFRLFSWRVPENRMQMYLETVLAREDFAKEVQLFHLGPLFLQRYRDIFQKLFREDRNLTLRRGFWGYVIGLLSTLAFYGAYAWIVIETARGVLSLGAMTMYLLLFKQGQSAFSASLTAIGQMYEDNLYVANLYDFLQQPVDSEQGEATAGPLPQDGIRFEHVSFTYPGAEEPAIHDLSLHLPPGKKLALVGENGSGKTTLIKLLSRLYRPTEGRILLDGLDLQEWHPQFLRQRIAIIFQDFIRFQLPVGENIGAGDVKNFTREDRWRTAAKQGMADAFIEELPEGFSTQLGRWFQGGRELSGGQWQKIALSRAFMRSSADILVLDEPTSAMDAKAEAQVFEYFQQIHPQKMAIFISHRFSTVRMADHIIVLQKGRILEQGSHAELLQQNGQYAHLFRLQAAAYH